MSSQTKSEKPVKITVVTKILKHGSTKTILVETQEIELPPGTKLGKKTSTPISIA